MIRLPPRSTRTDTLFPYTTLFRSRLTVFRAFPYLYDGDPAYEERYLATYLRCPRAVVVVAREDGREDGRKAGRIVGAATALPLADAAEEERVPFAAAGWPVERVCYFGESLLLEACRGRGLARSEAHRVGKECVMTCSSRVWPYH